MRMMNRQLKRRRDLKVDSPSSCSSLRQSHSPSTDTFLSEFKTSCNIHISTNSYLETSSSNIHISTQVTARFSSNASKKTFAVHAECSVMVFWSHSLITSAWLILSVLVSFCKAWSSRTEKEGEEVVISSGKSIMRPQSWVLLSK